jgi:hypothetical protein
MCVSRFSIPALASGENVTFDFQLALQRANEVGGTGLDTHQFCDRLAVLGDDDALVIYAVEKGEALFLKLGRADDGVVIYFDQSD